MGVPEWSMIILRSLGLFILAIVILRLAGRKVAARMTNADVVFAVAIGVIAAVVSLNLVPNFVHGLAAIHGGWLLSASLRYSPEDLLQQLRRKHIFNISDVEFAMMESDGEVNVLLKTEKQPLTAKDMRVTIAPTAGIQTVILDGKIMDEPLGTLGLNRRWLRTELDKIGIAAENVFLGQIDSLGELYVDLFDDAIQVPKTNTRQVLAATLEKAVADMWQYALETENEEETTIRGIKGRTGCDKARFKAAA